MMRSELQPALELARSLPADELPFLIGDLEAVKSIAVARITTPVAQTDETLNAKEAAKRLGISRGSFYRNHKREPYSFAWKEHGKLVASSTGLAKHQATMRR
jgi:hypothetical protein